MDFPATSAVKLADVNELMFIKGVFSCRYTV